jgi:sugar lactone lactonase YvrE
LSPDEKTLYFASNMPGTIGRSDLFKVQINDDGTLAFENLGRPINTEGRKLSFVNDENEIYFTSDGHPVWVVLMFSQPKLIPTELSIKQKCRADVNSLKTILLIG